MDPKPDYGYDSYRGTGKLEDKVALITGADSGRGPSTPVKPSHQSVVTDEASWPSRRHWAGGCACICARGS